MQLSASPNRPVSSYFQGRSVRLVTFREAVAGAPRVVWFPFGGGNALSFRACAERLPESWGAYALDPPGHVRTEGEPLRHVEEIRDLYLSVLPWSLLDGAVLVGHSLGSYVALALGAELEQRRGAARAVVIAAAPAPGWGLRHRALSRMNADELFAWISAMGALGRDCAEERQIFDLFEAAIRADIDAYETFREIPTLRAPVLVLAGLRDSVCRVEDVHAWALALPRAHLQTVDDSHLFVLSSPADLARHLTRFVEVS